MRALVFDGELAVRDDVEVRAPRPDEVLVRIEAAGLCHSDVSVLDGTIPFPTPVVMGHEGAGVVEALGAGAVGVAVGDRVILSTLGSCGRCSACERGLPTHCRTSSGRFGRPFTVGGEKAFQFANTSVFAERTVVKASQAVPIPDDVGFEVAALVGCGVITGVGAVLNRAKVQYGESAAVIGVGGIGLNVIQACRLAGALPIIAIDANPAKEAMAREFGATHFIHAGANADGTAVDTVAGVKEIEENGVAHAFECVGHPALIRQATEMLDWGGQAVLIGVPKLGTEASFVVNQLYNDKSIMGCRYGSGRPNHDFPLIIDLYRAGRLKLDELVSQTYDLADIETALDDLHGGGLARGVLRVPAG